jgi:hypothetical protein
VAATLFDQAVAKMEGEDYTAACPLLEQSYKLDAKLGVLFTLADCRDQEGKSASARVRYGDYLRAVAALSYAERSRHAERIKIAEKRLKEIGPDVPTLKLVWPGKFPAGIGVHVDDLELAQVPLDLPLPFDPGPHQLVVKRPGRPDELRPITLVKGQELVVDISVSTVPDGATPIGPIGPSVPVKPPVRVVAPKPAMNVRKTAGLVTLGIGGAGIVAGGILGLLAISEKQTVQAHCAGPNGLRCDSLGFDAVHRLRSFVDPSTAGFVVGGLLVATGVVLVVTAPSTSKSTAVTVYAGGLPGGGIVAIEGAF